MSDDPQQNEQLEDGERQVILATVQDIKALTTLLRGVNFTNRATISLSENGFSVSVEEARTLLARAYIFADMFDEFVYRPEVPEEQNQNISEEPNPTVFEIPLNTVIECLNIFGTAGGSSNAAVKQKNKRWRKQGEESDDDGHDDDGPNHRGNTRGAGRIDQYFGNVKGTSLRMSYAGAGYPLTLLIAEDINGPSATCEIATFEPDPQLDISFDSNTTVLKIILKSSWLRDALSELDPSCDKLTIIGHPPPQPGRAPRAFAAPRLRLQGIGTLGSTEMDYPNDKEVLETCECDQVVSFSYRFSHISRTIRALQNSTKTSLRIDEEGLLSLQLLMHTPVPRQGKASEAFIEFRCLAMDEDT